MKQKLLWCEKKIRKSQRELGGGGSFLYPAPIMVHVLAQGKELGEKEGISGVHLVQGNFTYELRNARENQQALPFVLIPRPKRNAEML